MPYVAGSMSTKIGRAPTATTALAVAMKLWLAVTTSSPRPTPRARRQSSSAAVQLETATAWGAPTALASSLSNAATSGPCATQPERMTADTASTSASPNSGRTIGICIERESPGRADGSSYEILRQGPGRIIKHEEPSGSVIGAATQVHRHLGLDSWSRCTRTPSHSNSRRRVCASSSSSSQRSKSSTSLPANDPTMVS